MTTTANDLESEYNAAPVADEYVQDDTETDDIAETVQYNIASYGVDFDVTGLVRRMNEGEIYVPDFQRGFVWSLPQASKFIESLLLGLPVPGIFLTTEPESERLMVIDGQQRLKTLQYYYAGQFGETQRPFALQGVNPAFEGMGYVDLRQPDRRRLDNSLFHATITRQLFPEEGLSSVFHIFERLNSSGQKLVPHEIRQAIYRGALLDTIREINDNQDWRAVFGGKPHRRQKDQELILRFWALYQQSEEYEAPMLGFLNRFAEANREPGGDFLRQGKARFAEMIKAFNTALQRQAFRTELGRPLNAAVFDSMSVGLARRIETSGSLTSDAIAEVHRYLLSDTDYLESVSGGTAQEGAIQTRISKAIKAFKDA